MSMAGFVIAWHWYKARNWVWYKGILTCIAGIAPDGTTLIWGKPNAQTLGWVQIYDSEVSRYETNLRVHENVHVVQAFTGSLVGLVVVPLLFLAIGWPWLLALIIGPFIGGLGFNILYGILFLYLYIKQGDKDWYQAYRNNPFEEQAYKLQDEYLANPNDDIWGV
jgi:hypothetical protein